MCLCWSVCVCGCVCVQQPQTHCNTLHHTATHCNTRQHTAISHCITRQQTAPTHCNNTLQQRTATTHCITLQHTHTYASWVVIVVGNTLQHGATQSNTLQHTAVTHCNTLLQQHIATHYNTFILMHHAPSSLWAVDCSTLQHTATYCNRDTGNAFYFFWFLTTHLNFILFQVV